MLFGLRRVEEEINELYREIEEKEEELRSHQRNRLRDKLYDLLNVKANFGHKNVDGLYLVVGYILDKSRILFISNDRKAAEEWISSHLTPYKRRFRAKSRLGGYDKKGVEISEFSMAYEETKPYIEIDENLVIQIDKEK
jgi:hypothetical protein